MTRTLFLFFYVAAHCLPASTDAICENINRMPWFNSVLMFSQRLRRWLNMKTELGHKTLVCTLITQPYEALTPS